MKAIDLGVSYDKLMPNTKDEDEKKHYPSFLIEGDEELNLPHEGTMTVHFKKTGSSMSERDGKHHYSCTVEVHKILDMEAEKDESPTKKYSGAEDALDKLMAEKIGKMGKSEAY